MLTIRKQLVDQIIKHALEENPNECCGILTGNLNNALNIYRISNTAKSPYRYLMDPQEFLLVDLESEKHGHEFVAFYHSHTHSPAFPSDTDVRMALQSGYLHVYYLLVSLEEKSNPDIRAYLIKDDGSISEQRLQINQ